MLLGLDAGKRHFAYALIEVTRDTFVVKRIGVLESPVEELTESCITDSVMRFDHEIKDLVGQADVVIFERAVQRPGRTSGSAIEYINIALGIMLARCSDLSVQAIPVSASTWKTALKRAYGNFTISAELFSQVTSGKRVSHKKLSDHEFDALCMVLWICIRCGRDSSRTLEQARTIVDAIQEERSQYAGKRIRNGNARSAATTKRANAKRNKRDAP